MADEQLYKRVGECNQCGDCCSDLPWAMKPEHFRNWHLDDLKRSVFPILDLVPFARVREKDRYIKPKYKSKRIKLGQKKFYYIFTEEGLHRDLPPYGNADTVSRDCPFLLDADEDEKRACGLFGTRVEHIWHEHCSELSNGVPSFQATKERVDDWFRNNPNCSFKYIKGQ